jgi:hypothetical protein
MQSVAVTDVLIPHWLVLIALADQLENHKQHEPLSDVAKQITTLPWRNREPIDAPHLESAED